MKERNYKFTSSLESYEDELPDDMTQADYDEWFDLSYVDGVRMGPHPERIRSPLCSPKVAMHV